MTYLAIIFVSPLYFASRKAWGPFWINLVLYGLAILTLPLLLFLVPICVLFWALAVGHAGFMYQRETTREHAGLVAQAMADELQKRS